MSEPAKPALSGGRMPSADDDSSRTAQSAIRAAFQKDATLPTDVELDQLLADGILDATEVEANRRARRCFDRTEGSAFPSRPTQ